MVHHLISNKLKPYFNKDEYCTYEGEVKEKIQHKLHSRPPMRYITLQMLVDEISKIDELHGVLTNKCIVTIQIFDMKSFKIFNPIKFSVDFKNKKWCEELCQDLYTELIYDQDGRDLNGLDRKDIGNRTFKCFSKLPNNFKIKTKYLYGNVNWQQKWNKNFHENFTDRLGDYITSFNEHDLRDCVNGHRYSDLLGLFDGEIKNKELYKQIDGSFENDEDVFGEFCKRGLGFEVLIIYNI